MAPSITNNSHQVCTLQVAELSKKMKSRYRSFKNQWNYLSLRQSDSHTIGRRRLRYYALIDLYFAECVEC
jgi:hypothetical protein